MSILSSIVGGNNKQQGAMTMADVIKIYKRLKNSQNQQADLELLATEYPEIAGTLDYIKANGGNSWALAEAFAKQNNLDLSLVKALLE